MLVGKELRKTNLRQCDGTNWQRNRATKTHSGHWVEYFHDGNIVPQDYSRALLWYTAASNQGDAGSQYGLARLYAFGRGVDIDYEESARLYELAAVAGSYKRPIQSWRSLLGRPGCITERLVGVALVQGGGTVGTWASVCESGCDV